MPNMTELAAVYIHVRDARDAAAAEHKRIIQEYDDDLDKLSAAMLALCNEMGDDITNVKTPAGTVMRQLKERYNCGDWEGFNEFVVQNKVPDLFERRIHQGNMKEFLKAHSEDGLPPGVSVFREYTITVRRPSQSAD